MSRLGSGISSVSLSDDHYGLLLKDNSFKVVRLDNNKTVIDHKNPCFNELDGI